MSLHRNILKETRTLMIASASGLFLFSQAIPVQSQEQALPKVSQPATRTYKEPALLQLKAVNPHPLFSVYEGTIQPVQHVQSAVIQSTATTDRMNRLYGKQTVAKPATAKPIAVKPTVVQTVQPVKVQPVLLAPPKPIAQTAGTRVPRRSLFDRLVGKVRGNSNIPAGPPQDPGMKYTTVTEAKLLQKTQAPKLVQQPAELPPVKTFTPAPVPGAIDAESFDSTISSMKTKTSLPQNFPLSKIESPSSAAETSLDVANAAKSPSIPQAFIPPMPGFGDEPAKGMATTGTPQSFPELKAMMQSQGDSTAIQVATSKKNSRPLLDLNGPLPLLEEMLEAEKAEEQLVQTVEVPQKMISPGELLLDIPAPEIAEVAAPMPAPAPAASNSDPLANPFPADNVMQPEADDLNAELLATNPLEAATTDEASVATAREMPATEEVEETEEPYSGLSLEEDLFLQAKVPAPAEPSSMLSSTPTTPEVAEEELGYATLEETSLPELPPFPSIEEPVVDVASKSAELTHSKEIPQLQAPQVEKRTAMVAPVPSPQVAATPAQTPKQSKMELIASRKGMTGLKGFCPVQLRDSRELVDTNANYSAIFNNKRYSFSNSEAMQKFLVDPEKYAPAIHGSDVIHLSLTGEEVEGTLDYAVWFKGRLYLFSSVETMETFVAAPNSHATNL